MSEIKFDGDRCVVHFATDVNGNPVDVEVPSELIEDKLGAENIEPDGLIDFVERNKTQIEQEVRDYLRVAPDVTGMRLGEQHLRHCR